LQGPAHIRLTLGRPRGMQIILVGRAEGQESSIWVPQDRRAQ